MRTNSITIEFDEELSCFKLLQAALDIGGNNIDLDKTIICKIVLEYFTYLLKEFKYMNKKTCYYKLISSLQTIQIPVQKSWIYCHFYLWKYFIEIDVSLDNQLLGYVKVIYSHSPNQMFSWPQ